MDPTDRPKGRRIPWSAVIAGVAFTLTLGGCCGGCCGGGGPPKHSCTAGMEYKGGTYSARGTSSDSQTDAKRRAEAGVCPDYCGRGDLTVNLAWDKYKATPEGQKSSASKSFDLGFQPSLKNVYEACKKSCEADIATNKVTITTKCD